ncbi:T9SS type A sorting domain-containing protein [Nitrosomonas nitrosa]|uniref:T9SS type A sorting domain-containing protein n=1 Tax=Nitrosomonas nitrosa TaxID=52442 RepID=UPI0023F9E77C|nr:T9SS type A sorting domain-containing protein [Nitrosomonas nitrosa]MCO6434787.1 T9SS type A sorting domain-containing protein [Nitrosomonas nitrosa]
MKHSLLFLLVMLGMSSMLYAQQKDTVSVQGYYESGNQYGTLNDAIDAAIANGTINNTVFKLTPYEVYVLNRSIYLDHNQNLEIVAPKPLKAGEGTAEEVQNSAPPQIVWTEEAIDRGYIIQSYGDVVMKNIWVRYADILGNKVASTSIVFENQQDANDPEQGDFDGCIFDYAGIGVEAGGAVTVKANHFVGNFTNCYFRNLSDNHFQYYGRAVSFPYQSTEWHYDKLLFENCTFTNIGRIVMEEGNEYGDNILINHCTMLNSIEWVVQTQGLLRNASITNSIFVNPNVFGYRALDVCDETQDYNDFEDGLCDSPGGGLLNGITPVDSLTIVVPFTDYDRKLFIGNNVYAFTDYMKAWYEGCGWCREQIRQRLREELFHPPPMLGEDEISFIDSTDAQGNKVFKTLNVDWSTIYDVDPGFIVEATNQDTFLLFVEYKWSTAADVDWSYEPGAGFLQKWPLPENLAYNNIAYQTAAMGGFPLGDLNWYPDKLEAWKSQRDAEWTTINNWLDYGTPNPSSVKETTGPVPTNYSLEQNYPNPFNPTTQIEYSIPAAGFVSLKVFNALGQEVATIFSGHQKPGKYVATFDASGLSSGVYMYRLQTGGVSIIKKLLLME